MKERTFEVYDNETLNQYVEAQFPKYRKMPCHDSWTDEQVKEGIRKMGYFTYCTPFGIALEQIMKQEEAFELLRENIRWINGREYMMCEFIGNPSAKEEFEAYFHQLAHDLNRAVKMDLLTAIDEQAIVYTYGDDYCQLAGYHCGEEGNLITFRLRHIC